jgi:cytochrome b involved in lipid metabolism
MKPICANPDQEYTLEEVSQHQSNDDVWTVYNGKVYDITKYKHSHPGGVAKIMLGKGIDCTELFKKYHQWVNCDAILGRYRVGVLKKD